jgi:polysaccharide biosynthesis transport protein
MALESPGDSEARIDIAAILAAVWARKLRIILVTVLLLGATYAVLMFVPKLYESSASILVEPRSNAYTRAPNDLQSSTSNGIVAGMMSSQMELIKSRDTLLKVIDSENLRSVPEFSGSSGGIFDLLLKLIGRAPSPKSVDETVLNNLLDKMTVIQERDSAVITVFVRSQDPALAAQLANAVAKAHVARRADLSLSDTAEASVWLEGQIETLRGKVADADNKVARFKVDNDLYEGGNNTSLLDTQLSNIATQITSAQERMSTAQSRADLIKQLLAGGQPIDGIPDVRDSVVIQQLSQTKATLQGERAQKSATLLPSHPTIQALDAQIAELGKQITAEGKRVASALEAQAQIEAATMQSLQDDLTRLKIKAGTATTDTVQLDGLEREAKAQRDLLESYLARYRDAASRTDASATFPDVRVITDAAPAIAPASPKTALILVAVGIVVFTLQVGSIIFAELISGRALTSRSARGDEFEENVEPPLEAETEEEVPLAAGNGVIAQHADAPAPDAPTPAVAEALDQLAATARVTHTASLPDKPATQPARDNDLADLAADVALGRVRVVMLASLTAYPDSVSLANFLVEDAAGKGLSICCVDAGSGRISTEPGITDLSAGTASYGDVVHKSTREGVANVPWGHLPTLDRRSTKPFTLVDALTDIYEVVVVLTGRYGMASTLPLFAGIDCRLVFVASATSDLEFFDQAESEAQALGYAMIEVLAAPARQSEVA